MRKILAAIITLVALFNGCMKNKCVDIYDTKIKIKVNVEATKAPVNNDFTTDLAVGVYAKQGVWQPGSANLINNDSAKVLASNHEIEFKKGPYNFPDNESIVDFYVFSPQFFESLPSQANISPKVSRQLTGQEDILWGTSIGYKKNLSPAVHPSVSLVHKLVQFQFVFKSGTGFPASGYKVISLAMREQPRKVEMKVETGDCVFSDIGNMQILSTRSQAAGIEITSAGTNTKLAVMTKPNNTVKSYVFDAIVVSANGVTTKTYEGININLSTFSGLAYKITLTFFSDVVTASASVSNWQSGSEGGGIVQ